MKYEELKMAWVPTNLSTLIAVSAPLSCRHNVAELSSVELTLGQEAVPQGDHGPGVDL